MFLCATKFPVDLFLQGSDGEFVKIDERGDPSKLISMDRGDSGSSGLVVLFYATLEEPGQPYYEATDYPGNTTLRVSIDFIAPPQDVGIELRILNGTLIFYRPPRYYSQYYSSTVVEEIPVPEEPEQYIFNIQAVGGGTAAIVRLGDDRRPVAVDDGAGGQSSRPPHNSGGHPAPSGSSGVDGTPAPSPFSSTVLPPIQPGSSSGPTPLPSTAAPSPPIGLDQVVPFLPSNGTLIFSYPIS
jgi:hypothetical protein